MIVNGLKVESWCSLSRPSLVAMIIDGSNRELKMSDYVVVLSVVPVFLNANN
jgi:hypothetical protein